MNRMNDIHWSSELMQIFSASRECSVKYGENGITSLSMLVGLIIKDKAIVQLLTELGLQAGDHSIILSVLSGITSPNPVDFNREVDTSEAFSFTAEGTRILRLAMLQARQMGSQEVEPKHLLLAILHDEHNLAKNYLEGQGITFAAVCEKLGVRPLVNDEVDYSDPFSAADEEIDDEDAPSDRSREKDRKGGSSSTTRTLDRYATDLTQKARDGVLDPVVGREKETLRMAQILCRRKKNNPILIGEPGVGKTAVVEGLAQLIVSGRAPRALCDKRICALNMTSIVAGTQYRGQFEERLKRIVDELTRCRNVILFIDEIHTIIGAGAAPKTLDAANILKPALARGEVQCIGATTIKEYRRTIEKDGALERRFQKVMVEPATEEETLEILQNIRSRYEEHHGVRYSDEALKACISLTTRYISERALPDKAIDALDEAGSFVRLHNQHIPKEIVDKEAEIAALTEQKLLAAKRQDFELAAELRDSLMDLNVELKEMKDDWQKQLAEHPADVGEDEVAAVVSTMCGVPAGKIKADEGERLRGLASVLEERVIGQHAAVHKVARAIAMNRMGIKGHDRPIGTFLFVGPTGVGKTHLVKCLAEALFDSEKALVRIDMSEYGEKYSTSRLLGAPPGYVGYEEGGQLTEMVRRHPYSVVLLDEIEKAHPDVFNTLLQVMDEGRMTDGNGVTVDFRNCVIIMTSNSGTRQIGEFGGGVGFNAADTNAQQAESIIRKSLKRQFPPEFLNRVDDVVVFQPLSEESAETIVGIELRELAQRLENLHLTFTPANDLAKFLVKKGFEKQYGARSLKRAVKDYVEDPLCDCITSMKPTHTAVSYTIDADHITFTTSKR